MINPRVIIEEINDKHNVVEAVEVIGLNKKGKAHYCPFHDDRHPSLQVSRGKNIISCFSCGKIGLTTWNFIKEYYGLNTFQEVAKKVNQLFNENIPVYEKGQGESHREPKKDKPQGDIVLKVNDYLSECNNSIVSYLEEYKHLMIGANTGLGKTFGIDEVLKLEISDYIFFLVPSRSIAEQVAEQYNYYLFYGDDATIPSNEKYIVATYDKVDRINDFLDGENMKMARRGLSPITYIAVVDEAHELKRDIKRQKRKDNKNLGLKVEKFIIDSDKSIIMSANVEHIREIYKDKLYTKDITVKSNKKLYNIDNLYIHRVSGKEEVRVNILLKIINQALETHNRVVLYEDNKKSLETLKKQLDKINIESVVIHSDSKETEEVQEHYNSIIKDSKLSKLVVLCTSVINAGVNIKNHKVALIGVMNKTQFDAEKIEQFFGRLREDNNNTAYLILNQLPKDRELNRFVSSFNYHKDSIIEVVEPMCRKLNNYYFYKCDNNESKVLADWNIRKDNDMYKYIKGCIYVENGIFKVDEVAVYEQARLEHLKFNYYDDNFIVECLQGVKARKIHDVTLIADEGKIKLDKEPPAKDNFKELLLNVYNDEKCLYEFLRYAKSEIRAKDFQQEHTQLLYEECKNNKLYREMIKHLKALTIKFNDIDDGLSALQVIALLVEQYTGDYKKSERDLNIDNLKRVEIHNKEFPIGSDYEDIRLIGDDLYYLVRKNCDCFAKNKNNISKRTEVNLLEQYITLQGGSCERGIYKDKKGEKIKPKDIQGFKELINNCIVYTYNQTKNKRLLSLN